MTDSPTLRDWFEDDDRFNLDDYDPYLFGEDLSDTLQDIHDRYGDPRKNVEAITEDSDFISPYERDLKKRIVDDIRIDINKLKRFYDIRDNIREDLKRKIIDKIEIDDLRQTFRINRRLWNEIRADIRGRGGSRVIGALTDDEILDDYRKKVIQKKGSSYFLTNKELENEIRERGLVEPF